jgi:hypothetical protein
LKQKYLWHIFRRCPVWILARTPAILNEILFVISTLTPGKCQNGSSNQAMTTSSQILSNSLFTIIPPFNAVCSELLTIPVTGHEGP